MLNACDETFFKNNNGTIYYNSRGKLMKFCLEADYISQNVLLNRFIVKQLN